METEHRTYDARASAKANEIRLFIPFNSHSEPIGGHFIEVLAPGAFSRALKKPDTTVALNNHNTGQPLGRVSNGTLSMREDADGLHASITVDTGVSYAADVLRNVKSGLIKSASFGFTIRARGDSIEQQGDGLPVRTIKAGGIQTLFDVSPVVFPAYPASQSRKGTGGLMKPKKKRTQEELMREIDRVISLDAARKEQAWASREEFTAALVEAGRGIVTIPPAITRPSDRFPPPRKTYEGGESFADQRHQVGRVDPRLISERAATGLEEGTPSEGGYLVPTLWSSKYLTVQNPSYPVPGLCSSMRIGSWKIRLPANVQADEMAVYSVAEAGVKTKDKPALADVELALKKLVCLLYSTEELAEDASALNQWLWGAMNTALQGRLQYLILRGTGAGQPRDTESAVPHNGATLGRVYHSSGGHTEHVGTPVGRR